MPFIALSSVLGLTFIVAYGLVSLHLALHPSASWPLKSSELSKFLMVFLPFFGCAAPGLMIGNFILYAIPPVRRVLDRNARGVPGASFKQSMRGFGKVSAVGLPTVLILGVIGAIEPWAR